MQDQKVKAKQCQSEGCNNNVINGRLCPNCQYKEAYAKKTKAAKKYWQNAKARKQSKPKTSLDKAISKAQRGEETAEKLFKKGLILWSDVVRPVEERCNCATCGKPLITRGEGIYGAHGGHYLDKANHWKLALEVINGIEQCKGCNCDFIHNPKRIELMKVEMRVAMVARHGKEIIDDLDVRGAQFRIDVKQGRENSKPRTHDPMAAHYGRETDIEFLKRKIQELKLLQNGRR